MFQKKFRYMTALLAALMITQGSFTAFADETPVGPGYEDQNKASTDTTTSDPASAWKKVNGVYVDANGKKYGRGASSRHQRFQMAGRYRLGEGCSG